MDQVEGREPQYADDYDDRTTTAVRRVLVEMGQILGSFHGQFVVIGGADVLAEDCRAVNAVAEGAKGYGYIAAKFETFDSFGPTSVREFIADSDLLGDRTPEQWQQDAFGQVQAWLRALKNL